MAGVSLLIIVSVMTILGFWALRSMDVRVTEALEQQHKINRELTHFLSRSGVKILSRPDALKVLKGDSPSANFIAPQDGSSGGGKKQARAPLSRPPAKAGSSAVSGAAAAGGVVIADAPPEAADSGVLKDRDGRSAIAPNDKFDNAEEDDGSDALVELRLTPAPPPPRPSLPKLPKGREWPEGDENFGFTADETLPSVGVVTLNGQAGGAGIGLAVKSSWMHRMSYNNKNSYCKRWGYDLIIEDNSIIDQTRDVAWSKIPIFKKWLPKYQWLLWIDMDAFFMRFDLPITDLIDNDHDLIIAKDWHGINFGVFLIRNSPWSFKLLDMMWNTPRSWWRPWEEQSALMRLIDPKKNPVVAEHLLEHIRFPRQRDINAYGAEFAYGNLQALYRSGDRIAHFPNCKGIRTCRNTIETFYRTMLSDNGIEDVDAADVPAAQLPDV